MARKRILSETHKLLLKAVGDAVLLIICVIPGIVLSFKSMQSPFLAIRVARARFSLQVQHIATFATPATGYRSEHIGGELLHVALLDATAWPSESIVLVPIGSLLVAILYYAVSRSVSRSSWTPAMLTLYASWYYPNLGNQFGTHTYTWVYVLFFDFLILLLCWLRCRTAVLSGLIMLVFTATFLHYHTTPLWIIVAIATAVAATKLKEMRRKTLQTRVSWALPLFCSVVYLTFDTVTYGNGLARIRADVVSESFMWSLTNRIIAPLLAAGSPDVLGPFETLNISPRIATWSTLSVLLLLTVPTGTWCLVKAYEATVSRNINGLVRGRDDVLVWAAVVIAITHILIYASYGALSLRPISVVFPLILPLVLQQFRLSDKLEPILASGLAMCAIVGFLSFSPTLLPDTMASETGLAAKLFEAGDRLLGDFNAHASLLLNAAEDSKVISFVWLDSDKYAAVVGQRPVDREDFDYLVVGVSSKPMITKNWVFFEPWTQHLSEINQSNDLSKIYDSENFIVFQPRGAELPSYQPVPDDIQAESSSLLDEAFWLLLTTIALAFVPGAVLTFIARSSSILEIDDIPTLTGLAVGISIAVVTFIGYIANFTPLGLDWFVPLCVLVPWGVLGIYLIIRRPVFRLTLSWATYGTSLVVVLLVWALLSTWAAHARAQRHAEFTELFVTQEDTLSKTISVNVVNRLNRPEDFTIVFKLDDVEVRTVGPRLLAPNSLWIEKEPIPPTLTGERLVITLEKDGLPYRELKLSGLGSG
jgi:hypothetical protein